MTNYFIFNQDLDENDLFSIFKEKLKNETRYLKQFDESLCSIQKGYIVYPFFEGEISNLEYFIINDSVKESSFLNVTCNLADSDFILNEHQISNFNEAELDLNDLNIINIEKIANNKKKFISKIIDLATNNICNKHNLVLTNKKNSLDIAPIKDFKVYNEVFYVESVYCLNVHNKRFKKPFKSVYSPLKKEFYEFNFFKNEEYEYFLKVNKSPIVPIPKFLLDKYYKLAFDVYTNTNKELNYINKIELYFKLKKNVSHLENSKHFEYLLQLIFFYKKRNYLADLNYEANTLLDKIFYYYLTLKYQSESAYNLAQLVKMGYLSDNYIKLLNISYKKDNLYARKELFDYFNMPRYKDMDIIKRFR